MSKRVQSTSQKDTDRLIVEHVQGPKIRGVDLEMGDKTDRTVGIVLAIVFALAAIFACGALSGTSTSSPSRSSKPWEGWAYVLPVVGILLAILALMVLVYLGARMYLSLARLYAEVNAQDIQARVVPADANGSKGMFVTGDKRGAVNLDALPGATVTGLHKADKVVVPEPATEAEQQAANQDKMIRLATAARAIPPLGAPKPPPQIREVSPDSEEVGWLVDGREE